MNCHIEISAKNPDGTLEVVGYTDYGNGRCDVVKSTQTEIQHKTMYRIAQHLADDTISKASGNHPDGSNIVNGMLLALLRAQAAGWDMAWFEPGRTPYEATKRVARENVDRQPSEFVDTLLAAMISEADKPQPCTMTWADRVTHVKNYICAKTGITI